MNLFLQRIWIQISTDRRKFATLCATVTVGLLLWARIIVVSNLPRTAVAEPEGPVIKHAPITSLDVLDEMEPIEVDLYQTVRHDPFIVSPRVFPRIRGIPDKSDPDSPEDPTMVAERREADLRSCVRRMKLEIVSFGDQSMASINGDQYEVGDRILIDGVGGAEFMLISVRVRSVVLECEGITFELKMPAPEG